MSVITDPLFYAFAVPAVVFLGLSKGGFSGIGMVSTPLLAIIMSPLEAAAILLPIILVQDVVSVWVYRRVWDPWNLKVMIPGCVVGVGMAWLLAAYVSDGAIRLCRKIYEADTSPQRYGNRLRAKWLAAPPKSVSPAVEKK